MSILCVLSKIFEKIIYEQIEEYLVEKNILYDLQSGFRASHSTDTCLVYLTDLIKKEIDSGRFCGMALLDLQKAFDTVDHTILTYKLKAIGFNSAATNWARSYLSQRLQHVAVNGTLSGAKINSCGVPQGSVLGPLLFLIYINDMNVACSCPLFLYADDAALLVSHEDKSVVEISLATHLENVRKWLTDNKLSLHLGKTETILFGLGLN